MKKFFILTVVALIAFSFTDRKKKKFKEPDGFEFVPSGSYQIDDKTVSVHSFFIQNHETTNFEYRSFLNELKAQGRNEDYQKAYPDTTAWNRIGGYMNSMHELYFWHPAYDDYPVVNVSKEGAEMYCQYLTDEYQKMFGESVTPFRLPQKYEWIYAAKGDLNNSPYPWGGPSTQNAKGCYLANYFTLGDQNITVENGQPKLVADSLRSYAFLDEVMTVAHIKSYAPNGYGLYDMSGNVAEMIADEDIAMGGHWRSTGYDIRVTSSIPFDSTNPMVGFRPVMTYLSK